MIKKDCDDWKRLQKKFVLVIPWIFSSNINEGIKAVSFFLQKDFACTKKHKTQTSDFLLDIFYVHKKHKKHKKVQKSIKKHKKAQKAQKAQTTKQATFFVLDAFYAHKNAAFFVFVCLDNFKLLYFLMRKVYTYKKH